MCSFQVLNWILATQVAYYGGKSTRLGVQSLGLGSLLCLCMFFGDYPFYV